jgi:hypothetical protein
MVVYGVVESARDFGLTSSLAGATSAASSFVALVAVLKRDAAPVINSQ